MTAEIAIMNKEAIALAADSAVTMANQKTIPSANKLFSLSKYHPVAIMIYQNAELLAFRWETIIKIYREKLGKKEFDHLEDYVNDFIEFLKGDNSLFPDSIQEDYFFGNVRGYFNFVKTRIVEKIELEISDRGRIDEGKIGKITTNVLKEQANIWKTAEISLNIPKNFDKTLIDKYSDNLDEIMVEVFENLIKPSHYDKLRKFAVNLFFKFPVNLQNTDYSGVVIAGFGKKDIFPRLKSIHIEGMVNNTLKYREIQNSEITRSNNGVIIPFAQHEMVVRFMEGVDPNYKLTEEGYLSKVFEDYAETVISSLDLNKHDERKLKNRLTKMGEEIHQDHIKKLELVRQKDFVAPILNVVANLPKGDLALMAESLVNLTSFKRKWSMERETVGGPIDVAVISKGDNFIWIKRKHYFDPELNHQFFKNYYR